MNLGRVDMEQLANYHPVAVIGSLLAGPAHPVVAAKDAEPLPEPAPRRRRVTLVARRLRTALAPSA
jgi:hypothetical protein